MRLLLGWDDALRGVLIAVLPMLDHFGQLRVIHICVVAAVSAALAAVTKVAEFGVFLGAAGAGGLCGVLCGFPMFLRLPARARRPWPL